MELLTIHETAALLKLSPVTIRRYVASGRLPAVKVGRAVRIRNESVEGLLEPVLPPHLRDDAEDDLSIPEGRPMTRNHSLFKIAGMFDTGPDAPGDVSENKYKYLAGAYSATDK